MSISCFYHSVLASCNEKEQAKASEKLLARWGRSLSQYSKCCSGMRCLACRRDPKSLLWTRNQKRAMVINDTPPPVAPSPATNTLSCWSKLKSRCRWRTVIQRLEFQSHALIRLLHVYYYFKNKFEATKWRNKNRKIVKKILSANAFLSFCNLLPLA